MNEFEITTEYCERTYPHGTIEVTKKDLNEWNIEGNIELVISSVDYENLCNEIQEVIRKYAI